MHLEFAKADLFRPAFDALAEVNRGVVRIKAQHRDGCAHPVGKSTRRFKRTARTAACVEHQQPGWRLFQNGPSLQTHPKFLGKQGEISRDDAVHQQTVLTESNRRGDLARAWQARQAKAETPYGPRKRLFGYRPFSKHRTAILRLLGAQRHLLRTKE